MTRHSFALFALVVAAAIGATLVAAFAPGMADARRGKPAPPPRVPASIELEPDPLFIRCDGTQSSTITVRVRDGKGKDLPNGTEVLFFNPWGDTDPPEAETKKGKAQTDVNVFGGDFPAGLR